MCSASAASAGGIVVRHYSLSGTIIRIDDFRPDDGWSNGDYEYGDRDHGMVSPRSIVRNLQRHDNRYISRPVLNGRFYQVKAINPHGRKVKLYIDAYSSRIVKIKA